MGFRNVLLKFIAKPYQLPVTYHYMKLRKLLEDELLMLDDILDGRELAIDIGANEGLYSFALSKLCKHVEAFEPQPKCAEIIKAYGKSNINVHNCGLSSFQGSLKLNVPILKGEYNTGYASFGKIEGEHIEMSVPVYKLDDFDFKGVSFIKIDVEGHESSVLEGGVKTITRERPVLLIEIEQRHLHGEKIETVFNQLIELSYRGYFLHDKTLCPISEFSYEVHQRPFLDNVLTKKYINNFIFKPAP